MQGSQSLKALIFSLYYFSLPRTDSSEDLRFQDVDAMLVVIKMLELVSSELYFIIEEQGAPTLLIRRLALTTRRSHSLSVRREASCNFILVLLVRHGHVCLRRESRTSRMEWF